jgi:REP element-mobilizing transposase RayT
MQHWNRHSISGDMERVNHLHMVVQSDDIEKSMKAFKQYTAKELLSLLKKRECQNNLRSTSVL